MASKEDREYIESKLLPELEERMDGWAKEYQQPRDLGVRGEFVGLYRKVRKLKTAFWDGVDVSTWREDQRMIMLEVIAHALLMLTDYDRSVSGEAFDTADDAKDKPVARKTFQQRIEWEHRLLGTKKFHPGHPQMTCKEYEARQARSEKADPFKTEVKPEDDEDEDF